MKTLIGLSFIFLLSTNFAALAKDGNDLIRSQLQWTNANSDRYLGFQMGPLIPMSEYSGIDPRFSFQFEYGSPKYYSIPIQFSFGNNLFILGLKPRLQYWSAPIKKFSKFKVAPSLGAVLNYWTYVGSARDANRVEFGTQLAAHLRYDLFDDLFVEFTPFSLDINFWRYTWPDAGAISAGGQNSDIGLMYSLGFGAGYIF